MKEIPSNYFLINRPVAHRGIFDNKIVFENTLLSTIKAIKEGYPVEADLRITKYNEVIVFHDNNIKRLTGIDKKTYNLTENDLNEIRILNGSKILKFKDLLNIVNGKIPLLLDLKCNNKNIKDFSTKVKEILKNYKGDYAITSFNPFIGVLFNNVYRGLIIFNLKSNKYFIYKILDLIFNYDFFCFNININNDIIKTKKPKLFWVIDDETKLKKAIKYNGNIIFEKF